MARVAKKKVEKTVTESNNIAGQLGP
ncbi:hypothetical protein CCACVL1_11773 [Corchorus capsularis]|uniref:Uncharacterized protein n=1 Tax=Corchorus capsularis TaxID=210143 RepID=A0A1R3IJI9_COCAP|nr:hypothetical protein CCACVL1_11773 [Corchorus capsularis]